VWHTSGGQSQEKPPAELEKTVGDGDLHGSAAIRLSLTEIEFPAGTGFIDSDLSGADLQEADLSGADLRSADLSEADLVDADLPRADLLLADLSGADLERADLSGADLIGTELPDAYLVEADLTETRLMDVDLSEANLRDADLSEANLRDADLSEASLLDASLDRVRLYSTTLEDISINEGTTADPPSLWELGADDDAESGLFGRFGVRRLRFLQRSESNPEDLQKAEQQYRRLERLYREANLSRDTDLEIQEKHARRKRALAGGEWGQWLRKAFSRWILGYGLRVRPVLGVMIFIILVWTLFYPVPGFASQSLEATNEAATNEAEIITYETVPPELSMETMRTLRRSLYFSTITFSTLGYADVAPIRWGESSRLLSRF
jgi:hypothetical protein